MISRKHIYVTKVAVAATAAIRIHVILFHSYKTAIALFMMISFL
jgi:hypothetical protein